MPTTALVLGGGPLRVVPPVDDIADAQAQLEPGQADEVDRFDANAIQFQVTRRGDIPDTFRAPEALGPAEYDAGFQALNRDGWLAVYEYDGETVTVYQQLGEYEVGSLPGGGERFEMFYRPVKWQAGQAELPTDLTPYPSSKIPNSESAGLYLLLAPDGLQSAP